MPNTPHVLGLRLLGAMALTAAFASLSTPVSAIDAGPVAIHGAVSATSTYSDSYNFLGHTDSTLGVNTAEVLLNGNYVFKNGLRLSTQLYGYKLGSYHELALDYASFDYSLNEHFGLRVGRVKRPAGLYGDTQDVDLVRPFAYLPLDFYPKVLRPITASYDGAIAYGNIPLSRAGSLDYQIGYGHVGGPDVASPYALGAAEASPSRVQYFSGYNSSVAWLAWNTPIEGLRLSASRSDFNEIKVQGVMLNAASLALAPNDYRLAPKALPTGYWDLLLAGKAVHYVSDFTRTTFSAEYTRGDWQFAAEYLLSKQEMTAYLPAPLTTTQMNRTSDSYYAMVTWQVAKKLQLGAYYGEGYLRKDDRDGNSVKSVPKHTTYLKDLCVAGSYSLTDWWLLKLETHFLNGTKGLTAADNGDAAAWQPRWTYVVVKSTLSF